MPDKSTGNPGKSFPIDRIRVEIGDEAVEYSFGRAVSPEYARQKAEMAIKIMIPPQVFEISVGVPPPPPIMPAALGEAAPPPSGED